MSILASYAANIESASANLNNAYAQQAQAIENHADREAKQIQGLKQTIQQSEELKTQRDIAQQQARAAFVQSQENAKTMKMLSLAGKTTADGKKIQLDDAMEIVNAQDTKALANYDAGMGKNMSLAEIPVAAVGAGVAGLGKAIEKGQEMSDKLQTKFDNTKLGKWIKDKEQKMNAYFSKEARQARKDEREVKRISKKIAKEEAKYYKRKNAQELQDKITQEGYKIAGQEMDKAGVKPLLQNPAKPKKPVGLSSGSYNSFFGR